jgi:transcriptional regulator with XRE-family HTH domain
MKAGMPYQGTRIAEYLAKTIDALSSIKSQREIAAEIGYEKPNMVSMFKRGEAKVPLDKIPALAKALNVDPAFLFRLAMEQYWPGQEDAIGAIFGSVITKHEKDLLEKVRSWTRHQDPRLITKETEAELREIFKNLA